MKEFKLNRRRLIGAGALMLGASSLPAWAELHIAITGVGTNQFPIAVKPFIGADAPKTNVTEIISRDLERTGAFRLIPAGEPEPIETLQQPADLKALADKGANAVVVGAVTPLPDGRWDVRYFLHDATSGELLDSVEIKETEAGMASAAHRIADRIYSHLTGEGPLFNSHLVYVAHPEPRVFQLVIADSDGDNRRIAFQSNEPIISPVFSPDGSQVAYVSFENQKPIVYVQTLRTGHRVAVARFEGNNSAPAFSPDGRWLAVALSRGGRTQIWTMAVDGSQVRRFTNSYAIDTEPAFSHDGKYIYFTSDRGGTPQIYRQPVAGGSAERVTFGSPYAVSPDLSPDGRYLAFVSRNNGKFQASVMNLETGEVIPVSTTDRDESPSFSPNSRFIIFATEENHRGVLAMASVDGRMAARIDGKGDIREPQWGPMND